MKSGYWQIKIADKDAYKTAFTVPFGHYEWLVQPFGLKNAPSEFQRIMNDIFNPYMDFMIVYIDDVLIFSSSIEQHWKHLKVFQNVVKREGLVVSAKKIQLFQTTIRFLGHNINGGKIKPIDRAIVFADKFPDVITDKTQLQRFLGSLNYIAEFYQDLSKDVRLLYKRLRKNPPEWTEQFTQAVQKIKLKAKVLPCLHLPDPQKDKIVETDASDIGYGGILKQKNESQQEELIRFTSGLWNETQKNYSTIKKEILSIVLCISKFQEDLLNKKFLLRIDCKSAKEVLEKDVKNIASKQIFARWQALLSIFEFSIEFIKGESNSLPDFLTREFLQSQKIDHISQRNNFTNANVFALFCRTHQRRMAKPSYERENVSPSQSSQSPSSLKIRKLKDKLGSPSSTPQTPTNPSPYLPVMKKEICIVDSTNKEKSIEDLAATYLTSSLEFPGEFPKTRRFYERILEETGSIAVQHKMRDLTHIAFSTINIKRIISEKDWNQDIKRPVFFKDTSLLPKSYNYFDYQKAWESVLNYQNPQRTHSWFISPSLVQYFDFDEIPSWFLGWFFSYGIIESCFPPPVKQALENFRKTYPDLTNFKSLFCFTFLYSIPWIVCWSLSVDNFLGMGVVKLERNFSVKWWAKFNIAHIMEDIQLAEKIQQEEDVISKEKEDHLKIILKGFTPDDLKKYLKDLESEGPSSSKDKGKGKAQIRVEDLQESQDPYADDDCLDD